MEKANKRMSAAVYRTLFHERKFFEYFDQMTTTRSDPEQENNQNVNNEKGSG